MARLSSDRRIAVVSSGELMFRSIVASAFHALPVRWQEAIRETRARVAFVRAHGMRYWAMSRYLNVPGFLHGEEACVLYDLARSIQRDDPTIVEIGSWMGKSSVIFGTAIANKPDGVVHCIDPFDGRGDTRSCVRYAREMSSLDRRLIEQFRHNVMRFGVADRIEVHVGISEQVILEWSGPIDLLFIDGDHSYECVKADFLGWTPWLAEGALVCFHDTWMEAPAGATEWHRGPGQIVQECVERNSEWGFVCHVGSLYCARKLSANGAGQA